jgi:hypothetical protein
MIELPMTRIRARRFEHRFEEAERDLRSAIQKAREQMRLNSLVYGKAYLGQKRTCDTY